MLSDFGLSLYLQVYNPFEVLELKIFCLWQWRAFENSAQLIIFSIGKASVGSSVWIDWVHRVVCFKKYYW